MSTKSPTVDELAVRTAVAAGPISAHLVTLASILPDGTPEVHVDDDGRPVAARLAVPAIRERLERAILTRQQAVVVFENGDFARPLIVGFVEPLESEAATEAGLPAVLANVDGRRVKLTAEDEIVLECGSASVTLRRNGRVIIRGTYVETHSEGTNRIKGGQVQIN